VWATLSSLVQVTLVPALTVRLEGLKAKFFIDAVLVEVEGVGLVGEELGLGAKVIAATAATTITIITMATTAMMVRLFMDVNYVRKRYIMITTKASRRQETLLEKMNNPRVF